VIDPRSEAALLARLRAGDENAFEALVRAHGPRMESAARRILRDEEPARDAVQDAFLQAVRALPRFEGRARLGTWLYRIAINCALMRLRSERRRREQPLDGAPDPGREPRLGEAIDERRRRERVLAAIGRLPESQRQVLALGLLLGLEPGEMAPRLGVSAPAAKARLHRARRALARSLACT
jgi:RNA polymerase sigma-70 factor (ECF subfamily)